MGFVILGRPEVYSYPGITVNLGFLVGKGLPQSSTTNHNLLVPPYSNVINRMFRPLRSVPVATEQWSLLDTYEGAIYVVVARHFVLFCGVCRVLFRSRPLLSPAFIDRRY
jgi:hypothetical protein